MNQATSICIAVLLGTFLAAAAEARECRIAGEAKPPSAQSMFVMAVSLHHGQKEFNIPHRADLERAGDLATAAIPDPAATVISIVAAPCSGDLPGHGYLGGPEQLFIPHVHGEWQVAEAALCGGHGRTAIAVGKNFSIVSARQEDYAAEIATTEGSHFGVFDVMHRASGHHYYFVLGTVESEDQEKRRSQLAALMARGKELSARFPTFVNGDFNLGAAAGDFDGSTVDMIRGASRALTLSPLTCTDSASNKPFSYQVNAKVHVTLQDTAGRARTRISSYFLDPRAPSPADSVDASSIGLVDTSKGLGMIHPMSGVLVDSGDCVETNAGMTWSCAGPIAGKTCVKISEGSDPNSWGDNYFCTDDDRGLQWSMSGPIAGLRCSNIIEPSEPSGHHWSDNYLCAPRTSRLLYTWGVDRPDGAADRSCVQWSEPSDELYWTDNFLCAAQCGAKGQQCCDGDCNSGLECVSGACQKKAAHNPNGCPNPGDHHCPCQNNQCMPPAACHHACP